MRGLENEFQDYVKVDPSTQFEFLKGYFLILMLDLVFRVQHVEYDLNIYIELLITTINLDIIKETKHFNTIDLQLSSNDIYKFSTERFSTKERIDTLNYVSDNHFLLSFS